MTVASLQLLFNDGRRSQTIRPGKDTNAVRAALAVCRALRNRNWVKAGLEHKITWAPAPEIAA